MESQSVAVSPPNIVNDWKDMKRTIQHRRHNHHEPEEHSGAERYLITYADLITLLLGLFVILYASSQVDASKYQEVAAAFSGYFDKSDKTLNGEKLLQGQDGLPAPILPKQAEKTMDEVNRELQDSFQTMVQNGMISIERTPTGLALRLSEALLFRSGKAELQPEGRRVVDSIGKIFSRIRSQVIVEGHTDSIPIRNFQYESNLHLSSARAVNVGYLLLQNGASKDLFSVRGFGDSRPLESNATAQGRAQNRRVEIMLEELPKDKPSTEGYKDEAQKL